MKRILLWGAGKVAANVLNKCNTLEQYNILGIVDNNKEKSGTVFMGYKVHQPTYIEESNPDKIVVLTDAFNAVKNQVMEQYPKWISKLENKNFFYKESILKRYKNSTDAEIMDICTYIDKEGLDIFNYTFVKDYGDIAVDVYFDIDENLYYVLHNGKRLYFSEEYDTEKKVQIYYNSILLEQDNRSPHRYLTDDFDVKYGDVVIDVGTAEGNFSLDVIDKVKKIYLIESNPKWIRALKATFKPYKDKVEIIEAFVTSYNEGKYQTLDALIKNAVSFIKMDIEGNEWDALRGADRIISISQEIRLAICSYHSDFDQTLIESYMDAHKIDHYAVQGYMWFPWCIRQNYVSTSLNRAVIRGIKKEF